LTAHGILLARRPAALAPSRRARAAFVVIAALMQLAATAHFAHATPSLETFVLTAGGESHGGTGGCATFMVPAVVASFFGGGVGIPLDGLVACNVDGGFADAAALVGPISATRSLDTSWPAATFSGTANVSAGYGDLAAQGHSVFNGSTSSTTVNGSESFGRCNDTFTITSPSVPNGQSGTVRFLVTVTGELSTSGNATADVELNYRFGPAAYTMFRSQANEAGSLPFVNSLFGVGLSGFVRVPGSMSGSGQVTTFAHAIMFGVPFDLDLGLFAYTVPGASSTTDSHFRAVVSGIEVTGPGGPVLPDFVAAAASGAAYGPAGVTSVAGPVPGTALDAVRLTAWPNPAASGTRLTFTLHGPAQARLEIFDPAGRVVRRLLDDASPAVGSRSVAWDGRDDRGTRVPRGAYYARLQWDGQSRTTAITLIN
jgi:hypothetical protein